MAAITPTLVNQVLADRVPEVFPDAVTKNSQAYRLFEKAPFSDAQGPRWMPKLTGGTASNYALGGSFPSGSNFGVSQASLDWGRAVYTLEVYGQSLDQLNAGNSELLVTNYLNQQINEGIMAMVAKLDAEILGGTTTNGLVGLQVAIDSTGTYANLNRSTWTNWASYQNDNTGTPRAVTTALMDTTHLQLVNTRQGNYTHILTTPSVGNTMAAITAGAGVAPLRQVIGEQPNFFEMGFGGPGIDMIGRYKGRPVIAVQGLAAGTAYFIDMMGARLEVLRDFTVSERNRVNDDYYFDITYISQFVLDNPRKGGAVLEDLT